MSENFYVLQTLTTLEDGLQKDSRTPRLFKRAHSELFYLTNRILTVTEDVGVVIKF
jgi:hypothetical protein